MPPNQYDHPELRNVFKHTSDPNKKIADIYINYIKNIKHKDGKAISEYNPELFQKLVEKIISKDEGIPVPIKEEIRKLIR